MKKLLFLPLLLLANAALSQDSYRNAVYFEALGNAGMYSVNYERVILPKVYLRGGVSLLRGVSAPVMAGMWFGNGNHFVEIAGGMTYVSGRGFQSEEQTRNSTSLYLTAFVGYRYHKPDKRLLFRAGYTPMRNIYDSDDFFNHAGIVHWTGVSIGHRFGR